MDSNQILKIMESKDIDIITETIIKKYIGKELQRLLTNSNLSDRINTHLKNILDEEIDKVINNPETLAKIRTDFNEKIVPLCKERFTVGINRGW